MQLLTYLSGLSGGSWLVSSLIANNFDSVQTLQRRIWDLATPIPLPGGDSPAANAVIYRQMIAELEQKRDAGFNVTLTGGLWRERCARLTIADLTLGVRSLGTWNLSPLDCQHGSDSRLWP